MSVLLTIEIAARFGVIRRRVVPADHARWDAAAEAVHRAQREPGSRERSLVEAGALMCEAYGVGRDVLEWWLSRAGLRQS